MLNFLHFASMILGHIFKGLLALIAVAIVGVNLIPMVLVGFGLLRENRNHVKRQNALTGIATPATTPPTAGLPVPVLREHY